MSLKLRKGGKDEQSGRNMDDEESGSYPGDKDENGHSRNPFHRAKKHIKTLISTQNILPPHFPLYSFIINDLISS